MNTVELSRWPGLNPLETIQLQAAKRGFVVNRRQQDALHVLALLSGRLILRELGESPVDASTRLVVEVDGAYRVDVDTDGVVGINE